MEGDTFNGQPCYADAGAGDVDADGFPDVLVSAPWGKRPWRATIPCCFRPKGGQAWSRSSVLRTLPVALRGSAGRKVTFFGTL